MEQSAHRNRIDNASSATANTNPGRRRRREPFSWLGLGAIGLGVGAALAAGSGVAYADTADNPSPRSEASPTSQTDSTDRASSARNSSASAHSGKATAAVEGGRATEKPGLGSVEKTVAADLPTPAVLHSPGGRPNSDRSLPGGAGAAYGTTSDVKSAAVTDISSALPSLSGKPAKSLELPTAPSTSATISAAPPIALTAAPPDAPVIPAAAEPAADRQLPSGIAPPTGTVQAVLKAFGLTPGSPLAPAFTPLVGLLWGATRKPESTLKTVASAAATTSAPATSNAVAYSVTGDWGAGHTAAMTVSAGSSALNGWTVEFDSPTQITNIWNAQITSHVGNHYVISNMPYNAKIAAGSSTSFGYQATSGAVASTPANLKVNGTGASTPPVVTPSLSIADVSVAEGNSGTSNANFVVTLSQAAPTPITVGYTTSNGTGTAGSDFTAMSGTLTFSPGVTSQTIAVKVTGDTTVESNETFTVTLSNPTGATLARASATGTITNDDVAAPPQNGANTVTYKVGDDWGSGHTANMTVNAGQKLNGWTVEFDSPAQITNIWNAQITSHVGTHYVISNVSYNGAVAAGGSTSFGYQATPGAVASTPTNIKVNGVAGANPPSTPSISISDKTVTEGNSGSGNAAFTVTLSSASTNPVTVGYSTANGTATAGSDYTATSGTLTFAPGVTSQTVNVAILGDTTSEPDETFSVALSNPSGGVIARGTATGTITNDDQPPATLPSASIADLSVVEGNGDHAHFMFTVTLSKASDTPVTVQYATADGTATGGVDYVSGSGTVTFAPGTTAQMVHVDIKGDSVAEPNETFTVTLSNPSGTTIGRAVATATIVDDDSTTGPSSDYIDITTFGEHGGSDHTGHNALVGGRTAITTEALVAYNNLREFTGLPPATLEQVGTWAFANKLTNNAQPSGQDLPGVGLYYAMQGAKVGWIADDKYDPQVVADIERTARLGSPAEVMAMVEEYGHEGFAEFLTANGYQTAFIDTLKMEPHYGGFMHSRAHGGLSIEGVATAHDVNHLTVLSHDQMQPFMNDTWDWPQWPALDVSDSGVLEYFQSMVSLGNPLGKNLTELDSGHAGHAM
jgi:hypothetical protein